MEVYELYIDHTHGKVFSVMELVDGREMFSYIAECGCYTENLAKSLFRQLLKGINFLHASGIVHRDLKPNNILVKDEGKSLKITDFNVAKFFDSEYKDLKNLRRSQLIMYTYTGTLAFSAPEVFLSGPYTKSVDLWSAGCVLYTMLSGFQPFHHK